MDDNGSVLVREGLCRLLAARLPAFEEDGGAAALARQFGLDVGTACWADALAAALVEAGLQGNVQAIKQVLALTEPEPPRNDGLLPAFEGQILAAREGPGG